MFNQQGLGKNREQKKEKQKNKGCKHNNIYSQKHIRIQQQMQENIKAKSGNNVKEDDSNKKSKKNKKQKGGYNKIVNPETGRKVSIYGKIGQRIVKKYIYELQGGNSSNYLY